MARNYTMEESANVRQVTAGALELYGLGLTPWLSRDGSAVVAPIGDIEGDELTAIVRMLAQALRLRGYEGMSVNVQSNDVWGQVVVIRHAEEPTGTPPAHVDTEVPDVGNA